MNDNPVEGDIIAAPATAWGEAAIGIIRLSGDGSVELVDAHFEGRRKLSDEPPRRMALGRIRDADTVLAVRFERGASYTGEESVEVHCHGGNAAVSRCMEIFTASGARVALPGEFTKRAFLSGRIDLAQAEAVLGVIRARSDAALLASGRSLQGELSARLRELFDDLTTLRAEIEVRLDYPEEIEDDFSDTLERMDELLRRTLELRDRCRVGSVLENGLSIAIVGRPNVGKSSLLNALLGEERAIVTDIPGTTRDTVDATFVYKGVPMKIVDTAGIRGERETADVIENMGVERARRAAADADICVVVLDMSSGITDDDLEIFKAVGCYVGAEPQKNFFLVFNKLDIKKGERPLIPDRSLFTDVLEVSALHGDGVDELKGALWHSAVGDVPLSEGYAATERIIDALSNAADRLAEAIRVARIGRDADAVGSILAEASEYLAAPLGADAGEELLDTIFSNFCVGK